METDCGKHEAEGKKTQKAEEVDFCTADFETSPLFIAGFYDGKQFYCSESIKQFLELCKYQVTYFHNLDYDLRFMLQEIKRFRCELIARNGKIIRCKVYNSKGDLTHTFLDSMAILPFGLRKLTKVFNVEHKKTEVDFKSVSVEELIIYNRNDTIGLYEVLQEFKRRLVLEKLPLTIPSFAQKELLGCCPDVKPLKVNLRMAYVGGRTEVFKLYGRELFYYDYNGLYASVMRDCSFPYGNIVRGINIEREGITYANIKAPDIKIPFLHYKKPLSLFFPVGKWQGCYTNCELRKALELGYEVKPLRGIYFEACGQILKPFAEKWISVKEHGDSVMAFIAKLILNSGYGRFGMREAGERWALNPLEKYGKRFFDWIEYDSRINLFIAPTKLRLLCPNLAIASYVTAYARIKLYELMQRCNMNVYYCDTDSVISEYDLRNEASKATGGFKCEYEIKEGIFLAPKLYALKLSKPVLNEDGKEIWEIVKAKGFYREGLSYANYVKALFGCKDAIKTAANKFIGLKESKIRNIEMTKWLPSPKIWKGIYDKRIIQGYDTVPYKVHDV